MGSRDRPERNRGSVEGREEGREKDLQAQGGGGTQGGGGAEG